MLKPVTVRLFTVAIPANLASEKTCMEVPEEPTAPTVRLTLSRGLVVPMPTFSTSFGVIPVPIPEGTAVNSESFARFVRPEPSPVNAVATIDPLNLDSPITRSLNPFAVDPIPTPSLSAQTSDVPDPTFNAHSPAVVVAIPTVSKIAFDALVAVLTLPKRLHALSVV